MPFRNDQNSTNNCGRFKKLGEVTLETKDSTHERLYTADEVVAVMGLLELKNAKIRIPRSNKPSTSVSHRPMKHTVTLKNANWRCGICKEKVGLDSVQCDGCKEHFHTREKCVVLEKRAVGSKWMCKKCCESKQ